MGLSFGRRRWPSEPCLVKKATAVESTGAGRWPKREASFNVHRPRSPGSLNSFNQQRQQQLQCLPRHSVVTSPVRAS
uniref:Uncharacterized protein n=1 Tax=Macrostomum lignano TaxID=282301 RepID=A0A1I8G8Q0_9PLAT